MGRLILLLVAVVLTALALGGLAWNAPQDLVLGSPAVSYGTREAAWLALGGGQGVLVVGLGGTGLVVVGVAGLGLFFAVGQLAVGLLTLGQVGLGLVGFLGQLGGGFASLAQLAVGVVVQGQATLGPVDGKGFFAETSRELGALLRFAPRPSPGTSSGALRNEGG
ncbi:MAG: hypothetical protein AAF447_27800 [Myxococcota bacterium]